MPAVRVPPYFTKLVKMLKNEAEYLAERDDDRRRLSRRQLLASAPRPCPCSPAPGGCPGRRARRRGPGPDRQAAAAGAVHPARHATPRCAGRRCAGQGYHVPNDRFFVRNHTATPLIDARDLAAALFGSGPARGREAPSSSRYRPAAAAGARADRVHRVRRQRPQLLRHPAGHAAPGTAWGLGAIGVARWRGVPLAEVLERAGVRRRAVDVMPEGLDATVVTTASTTARCAARCRSARRWTTSCSPTR